MPPLPTEDWALEAELRGVERMLGALKPARLATDCTLRQDAAHPAHHHEGRRAAEAAAAADGSHQTATVGEPALSAARGHAVAWLALSLGLATFMCGAVLLAWSFLAGRGDLWPLGMPLALAGQAGLIVGLVLQLDSLWHNNRQTARVLGQLDGELKQVRQATTLLSSTHAGHAQSFYLHLAEGASPQLLLTDLKGQLDLLAQQMARQGRA
jgi:hypothetical protein